MKKVASDAEGTRRLVTQRGRRGEERGGVQKGLEGWSLRETGEERRGEECRRDSKAGHSERQEQVRLEHRLAQRWWGCNQGW